LTSPQEFADVYDSTVLVTWDPRDLDTPRDVAESARTRRESCVVLTAWNPGHERPTQAENIAANQRLHAQLIELGLDVWPCDGASPDGTFAEPGFCVWSMTEAQARSIGRAFGQYAVFTFNEEGERCLLWL